MISNHELENLQNLAKLNFSDAELKSFSKDLSKIIRMVDTLKEVNCEKVSPLRSIPDTWQRFREDKEEMLDISNDLFMNVPEKVAKIARDVKCFVVPKVIE